MYILNLRITSTESDILDKGQAHIAGFCRWAHLPGAAGPLWDCQKNLAPKGTQIVLNFPSRVVPLHHSGHLDFVLLSGQPVLGQIAPGVGSSHVSECFFQDCFPSILWQPFDCCHFVPRCSFGLHRMHFFTSKVLLVVSENFGTDYCPQRNKMSI